MVSEEKTTQNQGTEVSDGCSPSAEVLSDKAETVPLSLSTRLEAGTEELIRARTALFSRTEAEIQSREALKTEEAMLLLSGEITGKNETERNAQLKARTAELRKALADAEADARGARLWLETCQDKVRLLRDLLRVEEVNLGLEQLGYLDGFI